VTWSRPDHPFIIAAQGAHASERFARLTYREADDRANQIAHALVAEGLQTGDRVLLYVDNSVEAVLLLLGIAKAGLVAVPVNPLLGEDVVEWVLDKVDPRFVVVDGAHGERAERVLRASGRRVGVTIPIEGPVVDGSVAFEEWIAERPMDEVDVTLHADDVWSLLFTSGTTSMPKASMGTHSYSHINGYAYAMSLTRGLAVEGDLVLGTFLPIIYHCGHNSTVFPVIAAGGTLVLGRRPDAEQVAEAVSAHGITALWAGAPAWVQALADVGRSRPDLDLTSLTVAMFAWGAMRPSMFEDLKAVAGDDVQLLEVFGQTEAMSCYRFWPHAHPEKFAQSLTGTNYVGHPNPILAADIHDLDGQSLDRQPGVPGEAVYRGPAVTVGYYDDLDGTTEAFRGGWFHSGDSCMFDEDGFQIIVDRYKDIVKSGGENVSSQRVEGVVAQHPAVDRVAVVGVPDQRWGEAVTAVVTLRPGHEVAEEELIDFCRSRLAVFERPKRVVVVDELAQTVGGKIMKYRLRAELA
jgi:acyl-CoA synthetase (AMP-forming)/AMP-acid ligase II